MSDTINEVNDLPEDEYDELPSKRKDKKKKEKKEKKKKKGGAGGKILCLILGFFLGIFFVVGAVAGGVYYVVSRPIDDAVNTIDNMTGADLYGALFGSTDENGEHTAGILNEKYAEKKVMDLLGDVGDAIDSLSDENGSLAALNEISPKVSVAVDGIVDTLAEYGICLDTQTILETPLKGDNGLAEYIKSSMSDIAAGDLLTTLSGEPLSPLFLSICYGKENVDYTIDEDGNVTMLGNAKKTTIGELTTTDISALFDDILLSDLMDLEQNYQSKILMHLLYGKAGVHYTLSMVDGKPKVTMEKMCIYKTTSGTTVIYNEEKEVLEGVSVDTAAKTYTDQNGNVYNYRVSGATKINGKSCDILYLCDAKGEYLKYSPTSVGDLMGENSTLDHLVNTLTMGEVFDDEHITGNVFLKHLKDETIESLPDAIANLTVLSVYKDQIYEADGVTLKGSWKYLLTDHSTGKIDETITVTDMQTMIDNMQANIHHATLFELKEDGVLSNLSNEMLNTAIKTSVAGTSLGVSFSGKSKLGDLTIDEMLTYVDAIIRKLP